MSTRQGYKKIIISCLVIGLLFATLLITSAYNESVYSELGSFFRNKAITDAENNDVVAELFNKKITQEQIDSMRKGYEVLGVQKTEDEIFRSFVVDLLLIEEAKENNIIISEKFVNEQIEIQMAHLKNDNQALKDFQDFINSSGITEQEYIELVKPIHERLLTIGTYKNQILLPLFIENNPKIPDENINEEFEKFYIEYKHDLFESANITYVK